MNVNADALQKLRVDRENELYRAWQRRGGRRCRSCGKPVLFARNSNTGKWQIVEAQPDWAKGNIVLHGFAAHELGCTVIDPDKAAQNRMAGVPYHLDHHATCEFAADYRSGGAS